jgi:dsDNA-specific endonuclease/ATPase MutS2
MSEAELPNLDEIEEIKGKNFTKRVALTTAIFAVILAIASLGGKNATKEALLAQQQASDQWAFYQAKVIRQHLYGAQKLQLEADLAERSSTMSPEVRQKFEALMSKFAEEEKRYDTEKKDIEKEAKKLEHERDINREKDHYFDYAEVLLQIAIVMSSISIISTSRPMFFFSLVLAIIGALLTLNGHALLVKIPFL